MPNQPVENNEEAEGKIAKKPCGTCSELIMHSAKKCNHCQTFQDWRRYITFSSSILSLLIALFSVMALSLAEIKNVFEKKESDLRISFMHSNNGQLVFLGLNNGSMPAFIGIPVISISSEYFGPQSIYLKTTLAANRVEGGEFKEVIIKYDMDGLMSDFINGIGNYEEVISTRFDGKDRNEANTIMLVNSFCSVILPTYPYSPHHEKLEHDLIQALKASYTSQQDSKKRLNVEYGIFDVQCHKLFY